MVKQFKSIITQRELKLYGDGIDELIIELIARIDVAREIELNVNSHYASHDIDNEIAIIDARVDDAYYNLCVYRDEFINATNA